MSEEDETIGRAYKKFTDLNPIGDFVPGKPIPQMTNDEIRDAVKFGSGSTVEATGEPLRKPEPGMIGIEGRGYYQRVKSDDMEVEVGGFKSTAELDAYLLGKPMAIETSKPNPPRWAYVVGAMLAIMGLWNLGELIVWVVKMVR